MAPKKEDDKAVRQQIEQIAKRATSEERSIYDDLNKRARAGKEECEIYDLSPTVCALIFTNNNAHNRDWRVEGAKSAREYERRMKLGQWRFNNQGIGFYKDGQLEDGQHRISGAALANFTLRTVVTFGIDRSSISTVDDGLGRHGADASMLDGINDPTTKEHMVRMITSRYLKMQRTTTKPRSNEEFRAFIEQHNAMLSQAIELGSEAHVVVSKITSPLLKPLVAYVLTYELLDAGLSPSVVSQKVKLILEGRSPDGSENSPFWAVGAMIKQARDKADGRGLTAQQEINACIWCLKEDSTGPRPVTVKQAAKAIKNTIFDAREIVPPKDEAQDEAA